MSSQREGDGAGLCCVIRVMAESGWGDMGHKVGLRAGSHSAGGNLGRLHGGGGALKLCLSIACKSEQAGRETQAEGTGWERFCCVISFVSTCPGCGTRSPS